MLTGKHFTGSTFYCLYRVFTQTCYMCSSRKLKSQQWYNIINFLWSLKNTVGHTVFKKIIFFWVIGSWLKFFVMNWAWISHFAKGNKSTDHTNGIHITHQKTQLPRILPTGTESQNTSQHKRIITTDTRQNQLAKQQNNSARKWSSTSDSCQNHWQRCPNSTSCSKEKLAVCSPTNVLGHGARQLVQMHDSIPPRRRVRCSQCWAGERQGDSPPKNGLSSSWEHCPKPPAWEQWLLEGFPASHHGGSSALGKAQEPGIARAQPHAGAKNSPKVGSGVCHLKANTEASLLERKALFWRLATSWGVEKVKGGGSMQKQHSQLRQSSWYWPLVVWSVSSCLF